MTESDKVVMQQALDALEGFSQLDVCRNVHHHKNDYHGVLENCPVYERHKQTITDLRAAIAQQEQRTPLTETALCLLLVDIDPTTKRLPPGFKAFARAIEAAHGIAQSKDKPAMPTTVAQYSRCSNTLRNLGNSYPRTCAECGLGPCKTKPAQPEQQPTEKNFCARCGKRLSGDGIHTCTPPKAQQ